MKPAFLTARDQEIVASATAYRIVHGSDRHRFENLRDAIELCEQLSEQGRRGALLYACGEACGVPASALIGSAKDGRMSLLEGEPA